MSNVRAEVLRVSRSRTGWREGAPKNNQRPYISSLKSTFEGSNNGNEKPATTRPDPTTAKPLDLITAAAATTTTTNNSKPQRPTGTKVSTIANMFQSMSPATAASRDEVFYARPGIAKPDSPRSEHAKPSGGVLGAHVQSPEPLKLERRSSNDSTHPSGGSVHLNRTESHLARFNNARAMFERLEEQSLRTKSGYCSSSPKRSGSVSPSRSAFSPPQFSRSPSPIETQSVGSSPKHDSPLSPRDKSQSADCILSGRNRENATSAFYASSHLNGHKHNLDLDLSCSGAGEAIVSPGPLSPHLASYLAEDFLTNGSAMVPLCDEEKLAMTVSGSGGGSTRDKTWTKIPYSSKPSPVSPKPVDVSGLLSSARSGISAASKRRDVQKPADPEPSSKSSMAARYSRSVGTDSPVSSASAGGTGAATAGGSSSVVVVSSSPQRGSSAGAGSPPGDTTTTARSRHIPPVPQSQQQQQHDGCDGSVRLVALSTHIPGAFEKTDEGPTLVSAIEKKKFSTNSKAALHSSPSEHLPSSVNGDDVGSSVDEAFFSNGIQVSDPPSSSSNPLLPAKQAAVAFDKVSEDSRGASHSVTPSLHASSSFSSDGHNVSISQDSPVIEATNEQLLLLQHAHQSSSSSSLSHSGIEIVAVSSTSIQSPVVVNGAKVVVVEDLVDDTVSIASDNLPDVDDIVVSCDVQSRAWRGSSDDDDEQQLPTIVGVTASHKELARSVLPTTSPAPQPLACENVPIGASPSSPVEEDARVATQGTSPLSPKWEGDSETRDKELKVASLGNQADTIRQQQQPPVAWPTLACEQKNESDGPRMTPEEDDRSLGSEEEAAVKSKMLLGIKEDVVSGNDQHGSTTNESVGENVPSEQATVTQQQPQKHDQYEEEYDECVEEEEEDEEVEEEEDVEDSTEYEEGMDEEKGVHVLEDGHFWVEIPGLPDSDEEEVVETYSAMIMPKKKERVKFSSKPIRVYSTFSVMEYDRRNDDVDPVSASAEYELEKRVEKMDVFPVELMKGPEGLGLSIIGMGVGADAGLEKLGIFIKTITEGGAAHKDGRIQVNDQIIEVDGKSLVGVTQAYAASVLRNTSGLVRFQIGREKDGENSEVAQLIFQSLQADREREDRRKAYEQELQQQRQHQLEGEPKSDSYPGLTLPIRSLSAQLPPVPSPQIMVQEDSTPEEGEDGPTCEVFDLEESSESPSPDADVAALKIKLKEAQYKNAVAGAEIAKSKVKVAVLENLQCGREENESRIQLLSTRVMELERLLESSKKEVMSYQDMLEESQGQYIILEKKYYKAKKLIKECHQREQELFHREEYHVQQLQEKDQEYNALVKSLKDRIIQLEQDLMETQRSAGLPVKLPYDNTSIKQLQLTPQQLRKPQVINQKKRCSKNLDADVSDSELSDSDYSKYDISPDSDDTENKTSTVERKPSTKEDVFEKAVPQHELLDSTAAKTKAELANKGSLANRQPPSLKKAGSSGSSGDGLPCDLKDSDSSASLGSSREDLDESADPSFGDKTSTSASMSSDSSPTATPLPSLDPALPLSPQKNHGFPVSSDGGRLPNNFNSVHSVTGHLWKTNPASLGTSVLGGRGSPVRIDDRFAEEMRIILERKNFEVKRQVASEEFDHDKSFGQVHVIGVQRNVTSSPGSTVSSRSSSSNATGGSDTVAYVAKASINSSLPSSKRERSSGRSRFCPQTEPGSRGPPFSCCCFTGTAQTADSSSSERTVHPDESDLNVVVRGPPSLNGDQSSVTVLTGGGGGGAFHGDPMSDRRPHQWHSCSVTEWSTGQVGQWLLALSMEQYISTFMDNSISGLELLNMDGTKLKMIGVVNSSDRSLLKKKVKDLKVQVEKERRAAEKELKAKEKQLRKAERAGKKK